jgi:hypothetical protein
MRTVGLAGGEAGVGVESVAAVGVFAVAVVREVVAGWSVEPWSSGRFIHLR